ncbi:MAG: hypothetical protein WCW52_05440 [Elusimicrobiales bacterium]|jgi:hypothetical protein
MKKLIMMLFLSPQFSTAAPFILNQDFSTKEKSVFSLSTDAGEIVYNEDSIDSLTDLNSKLNSQGRHKDFLFMLDSYGAIIDINDSDKLRPVRSFFYRLSRNLGRIGETHHAMFNSPMNVYITNTCGSFCTLFIPYLRSYLSENDRDGFINIKIERGGRFYFHGASTRIDGTEEFSIEATEKLKLLYAEFGIDPDWLAQHHSLFASDEGDSIKTSDLASQKSGFVLEKELFYNTQRCRHTVTSTGVINHCDSVDIY